MMLRVSTLNVQYSIHTITQRSTRQYNTLQDNAIEYKNITTESLKEYNITQYNTILYKNIIREYLKEHHKVKYSTQAHPIQQNEINYGTQFYHNIH